MVVENGCYTLKDTFDDTTILGLDDPDGKYRIQLTAAGNCRRAAENQRSAPGNKGRVDGKWLDEKDPLQNAYVQANGQVINRDPYHDTITDSAEQKLH
ncbi:hypothetical protein ACNKHR_17900 [Shigella flexneri]